MHVGHTEANGGVADLGVFGDVHEVAARGELAAAGEAVPVHLGDHRLGEIPDAHPALGHVPRPLPVAAGRVVRHVETFVAAAEVVAGREAGAGAAHDLHAHVGIGVALAERVQDPAAKGVIQCVALLGSVEGHAPHLRCRLVDQDDVVVHEAVS